MTTTQSPRELPGRLGDPDADLRSDPRSDPRMLAAFAPYGLDRRAEPPPVSPDDPLEARLAHLAAAEEGFEGLFAALMAGLDPVGGVTRSTETIPGDGGHDITLHISRPEGATAPAPGVLHLHGGGMTLLAARGPAYQRWRDELAATGLVVVGVEFRNAAGALGAHPFPAGLDDCTTALEWVHARRECLGVSTLVVSGESGGGNLTLATAIRAKREDRLHMIDGVYALVPFISGAWGRPAEENLAEFPSVVENDGYFITNAINAVIVSVYDPGGANARNPLCWPYWATPEDLAGLPPHAISVDELDLFRDEGLGYYRKLVAAGVPTTARSIAGVCHAGELMFRAAMPDLYAAAIADVSGFVHRLAR